MFWGLFIDNINEKAIGKKKSREQANCYLLRAVDFWSSY